MELRNGDLFGIPPHGFLQRLICKILGAHTVHYGMIVGHDNDGYICSESIGKGTAVTRFEYEKAYIYRIKNLKHEPETSRLVSFHSWRGEYTYDYIVNFITAVWFIFKHYLKILLPVVPNRKFNCQEHVIYMASCLGVKIISELEHPYCVNIENSDYLEFIGEYPYNIICGEIKPS